MRLVRGLGFTSLVGALMLGSPSGLRGGSLVLDAEVMQTLNEIAIPGAGSAHVRSAVIHHKHARDQAAFCEWLRGHQSGVVKFVASGGGTRQGIPHRLKHSSGRGLLLYTTSTSLAEEAGIRLELPVAP